MSKILDFYDFKTTNNSGKKLTDIWECSLDELERSHDYIQWLFPSDEPSKAIPSSPILAEEDIEGFLQNRDRKLLLFKSLLVFLDFLGLAPNFNDDNSISIVKSKHFDERKEIWISPRNHNYKRITRILICLKLLGLEKWSKALYNCLNTIYNDNEKAIGPMTKRFWDEAISGR